MSREGASNRNEFFGRVGRQRPWSPGGRRARSRPRSLFSLALRSPHRALESARGCLSPIATVGPFACRRNTPTLTSAARARSRRRRGRSARVRRTGAPERRHRLHGRHGLVRSGLLRRRRSTRRTSTHSPRAGLRFTHYTTHPLCSPARAALLTGMNAHAVGTGWLANNNAGYPGYSGEIPLDAPTLAETLRAAGYETIMTGKWHNTPTVETALPRGTEAQLARAARLRHVLRLHGGRGALLLPRAADARKPARRRSTRIRATTTRPTTGPSYAIESVKALRASSPTKPFLLYIAHNAVHAPLQAKPADLAKYRGRYDAGWTAMREARWKRQLETGLIPAGTRLPVSDPRAPRWQDTDPADRPLLRPAHGSLCGDARLRGPERRAADRVPRDAGRARQHDHRVLVGQRRHRRRRPDGNVQQQSPLHGPGAAADRARARAMRTTSAGRAARRCIRPAGARSRTRRSRRSRPTPARAGGACRSSCRGLRASVTTAPSARQFVHVTDVMPTLLELAGVAPLTTSQRAARARDARRELRTRALRRGRAVPAQPSSTTSAGRTARSTATAGSRGRSRSAAPPIDLDNWTLHDLEQRFLGKRRPCARSHPEKLTALTDAFDAAAWQYFVYPLDNRDRLQKFADAAAVRRARSPTRRARSCRACRRCTAQTCSR